jgi:hypothetical protein
MLSQLLLLVQGHRAARLQRLRLPLIPACHLSSHRTASPIQMHCSYRQAANTGNLPGPSGPCSGAVVTFAQGKNHFRGPSYFNTDFAVIKKTKLPKWEKVDLGIGVRFFNLFNHPNFGFPDSFLSDQMFGQIGYLEQPPTSILGAFSGAAAPRMIQLKAQFQF